MLNLEKCVKQGAKLLDKKLPGWFSKIKVNRLKMSSNKMCIIGQLYDGDAWDGIEKISAIKGDTPQNQDAYAEKHGFFADNPAANASLVELWEKEIDTRKEKAKPSKPKATKKLKKA